jgi:hypothetical protein
MEAWNALGGLRAVRLAGPSSGAVRIQGARVGQRRWIAAG